MKVIIYSICPYCGLTNVNEEEFNYISTIKSVVTCDVIEGGCDKDYVVSTTLKIECESLKIEVTP